MTRPHSAKIFHPNNAFDSKINTPGGIPMEEALNRATAAIEQARPDIEIWMDTALAEIGRVAASVKAKGIEGESLEMLKRNASYLHDLGTTMGFPLITFVAKNFCDVLETVQSNSPSGRAMIECHASALALARHDKYRNLKPEQVADLTEGLLSVLKIATAPNLG